MYKRAQEGYLEWLDFDNWKEQAVEKRDVCNVGKLPFVEYVKWVDETSRQRNLNNFY